MILNATFSENYFLLLFLGSVEMSGGTLSHSKYGSLHACYLCSYSTHSSGHLKLHALTHTGTKPFVCNVCHKSFRQKGHLKTHYLTHSTDRPFKCSKCGKSFLTKQNFNKHTCQDSNTKYHAV